MLPLERLAELFHFLQRRSNQSADAHEDGLVLQGRFENRLARHHDTEVNHFEAIASQHDADDVLPDVVDVAVGRGEDHARKDPL